MLHIFKIGIVRVFLNKGELSYGKVIAVCISEKKGNTETPGAGSRIYRGLRHQR